MSILKTEDLTFIYAQGTPYEHTAVDHVNIEFEKGELVGIIGHTGSGKSTLIQQFNGLLKPTSGRVLVDGEDIWADPSRIRELRFKVGLVFQYPEYQLFEETVYKDISFGPKNMGFSGEELDARVREAAAFVGLREDLLERSPFELSGGQKRRVAIAGVLAMRPEILILDEPTAGLDPKGRERILGQIRDYHRQTGGLVLLVSHSMEDIANYATRALVVNDSKIYMYDTVDNVFAHAGELKQMGLAAPQISDVFNTLAERGLSVPHGVYTVARARDELLKLLKGGERDAR